MRARLLGLVAVVGCTHAPIAPPPATDPITITIDGTGLGVVSLASAGATINCTHSCKVQLANADPVVVKLSTHDVVSTSPCPDATSSCDLEIEPGDTIAARFDSMDARAVATLSLDDPGLIGFIGGDLVVVGSTALHRIRLDGSEVWTTPLPQPGAAAISSELIVTAPTGPDSGEISAYAGDGTLAWTAQLWSVASLTIGPTGDVIVGGNLGQLYDLGVASGGLRWTQYGPYSERIPNVVRDSVGTTIAYYSTDSTLTRFGSDGTQLGAWTSPMLLDNLVAAGDSLVGLSLVSSTATYTFFDMGGQATSSVSEGPGTGYPIFDLEGETIFEVRNTDTAITISSLDTTASLRWTIDKSGDAFAGQARCDGNGHCAIAGSSNGCTPATDPLCAWIEVFDVR
jgi:hypothetical protein